LPWRTGNQAATRRPALTPRADLGLKLTRRPQGRHACSRNIGSSGGSAMFRV
jgi:hypothetical protein